MGGCPSGQWELTVNQPAGAYDGSNPSPPTMEEGSTPGEKYTLALACTFSWVFALFPAHIAQSVEHILGKNEVIGSSPIVGSPMFVKMPARSAQVLQRLALDPVRHGVRINTRRQRPPRRMASYRPT